MKALLTEQKNVGYAKALIKNSANIEKVEKQIEMLRAKKLPESCARLLDNLLEQME